MHKDISDMTVKEYLSIEGHNEWCLATICCIERGDVYKTNLELMLKYLGTKFSNDLLVLKYNSEKEYTEDFAEILGYIAKEGYSSVIREKYRSEMYEQFKHISTDVIDWLLDTLQREPCIDYIIHEMHYQLVDGDCYLYP